MSAPEAARGAAPQPGVRLTSGATDLVELAAFRGRDADIARIAAARGVPLPQLGRSARCGEHLALCVRPARWLILAAPGIAGAQASLWQPLCAGVGAVIDLAGAVSAVRLAGPAVREMLSRACRLDLRPHAFPPGSAAATIMVQVPVTLAAHDETEMLLLTPATTARHLREWLVEASRPFGVEYRGDGSK